jgi:N-methylhydantoinase A
VRFGVDIGGTFTDLVAMRGEDVVSVAKVLTTPDDPSLAVVRGIEALLEDIEPGVVSEVVHGTTLVPNALIERRGARTALITTAGFRDTLAIRREHRYDIYDLFIELPPPLVPRRRRWEVPERVLSDGTVDTALDVDELVRHAKRIQSEGVESVAICFLHSYRAPEHEQQARAVLREAIPSLAVSTSSDVVPEIGEYVRSSTTVVNAYVQPLVDTYLARIQDRLKEQGIQAPMHVMLSTGGLADVDLVRRYPIRIVESGPAAGVISAAHSAATAGIDRVLAFDMGGTTAKACLVEDGVPLISQEHEVARVYRFAKGSGLPVRAPVVDLIEIGAGGGSIARVDTFGLLEVGPRSASAEPGPACYGLGGSEPTVTDADLLLGYLDPSFFLGGTMRLDTTAAEAAVGSLGDELGLTVTETAAGIHRVVNENMAAAGRVHAIERGRNARDYTVVATGGAGPVHAWGVARALGARRILFPPSAGVASAFGMLVAPPAFDFARSMPSLLAEVTWPDVEATIGSMRGEAAQQFSLLDVPLADGTVTISADIRYHGQGDTVTTEIGERLDPDDPAAQVQAAFEREYLSLFGRRPEGVAIEVVTWRLRLEGRRAYAGASAASWKRSSDDGELKGHREVWSEERREMSSAKVYDRYALAPGTRVDGPAIFEERESSAVIGHGSVATVDENLNIVVEIDE